MRWLHWILQGKGGVGKSFAAYILFQYFSLKNAKVYGIDTDPINPTFGWYKEFNVEILPLMVRDEIEPRAFDLVVERSVAMGDGSHVVVDSGSSTFKPASKYLHEGGVIDEVIRANNVSLVIHTVINGGPALQDTIDGLVTLATNFTDIPIVVWLNPKDGDIQSNGHGFYDFLAYKNHSSQFHSVIELPHLSYATYGKDLVDHLARKQSFDAAIHSSLSIMTRHRLGKYWEAVVEELDKANLLEIA